ncbi:MAG: class I SAM-dependent methyltransferase [Vulcanimicrobiaceae bacterium]
MNEKERFTTLAGVYNAGRPGYPPEVGEIIFEGLGDPRRLVVADLGAGTGSSSLLLAAHGADIRAVEPNAAMRAKGQTHPRITWIAGSAEKTTLPDASVDVVTAFQAFHWFDPKVTFAEILRILKPGGRAAIVYYERDESDPFAGAYGNLVRKFATDDTEQRRARTRETFALFDEWRSVRQRSVPSEQVFDRAGMFDRVSSSSYLPHTGPESEKLNSEVEGLFDAFVDDGKARMGLQYLVTIGER